MNIFCRQVLITHVCVKACATVVRCAVFGIDIDGFVEIIQCGLLIPYSLNPAHYGITFRRLGLPDKIAYAMDLTMRFIPTFGRDFQLTMDAQKARGYEIEKLKGGLFAQVRKLAPLIVPVTIHAIAGSEDIIDAMDLRGFGVGPRTWLVELKYRKRDYALMAFGLGILLVSILLSLWGFGQFWVPEALIQAWT